MNKFLIKIKKILKLKFDLINNERVKRNLLNAFPFWISAFVSGVIAVLYAKLFGYAEMGTHLIFVKCKWALFVITPVCFLLAWWLVNKFSPYARGSGIPQVSAAIELANPRRYHKVNLLLSLKIIFIKIISSLIFVFGGGVIGREGPTIQISASIFKKVNDMLPEWFPKISKQNMIVTGGAAGLAAAFNTPLGGIVFAIEELTKTHFNFFKSALLTGVIISGLTALSILGPYLYLGYPLLGDKISPYTILIIIPLAVITGLAGCGCGEIILYLMKKRTALPKKIHRFLYILICGLIIAVLAVFIDEKVLGSGKGIMITTLFTAQKNLEWYVPFLRMSGSIISFSTGAAGGIFAPSLSAGASIGAVVAGWFHLSATSTNLIILCGMAGFLTSITRSPFTCAILVLEMTNSHNVIFYILLTALVSNLFAGYISRHSFYDKLKDKFLKEIMDEDENKLVIER